MRNIALDYQRTERRIANEQFYPVHLTNSELESLMWEIFEWEIDSSSAIVRVFVRTDKGGKGIDVKLEETLKKPHQIMKQRMFSFGLNANWKVVDFFEHYTDPSNGEMKVVAGKKYMYPKYIAQEYIGYQSEEVDRIYGERRKNPQPPMRNALFQHEDWTCIYEQAHHLTYD